MKILSGGRLDLHQDCKIDRQLCCDSDIMENLGKIMVSEAQKELANLPTAMEYQGVWIRLCLY